MELHDPVAICTAASNIEAHEIAELLLVAGVAAKVIEDNSQVGVWIGGLNSVLHKPKVWVSSSDLEAATAVVREFEERAQQRTLTHQVQVGLNSEWIDARCDKCGTMTRYAPVEKGTVVNCPSCYAFMDVGGDVDFDDWNVIEHEGDEADPDAEVSDEVPE